MRRLFEITPLPPTVDVPQGASGRIVFTVTNRLPKTARVRTLVQAGEKAPGDGWVCLDEPATLDLEAENGSGEIAATIEVPVGTEEGEYLFRLRVVSTDNPDDDWTDSALITLRVGKGLPPPPPPRRIPWLLIAAIVLVLAVAGGIAWVLASKKPTPVKKLGEACTTAAECASGLCKDQVCVTVKPGTKCASDAECAKDQTCTAGYGASEGSATVCLLANGSECTQDHECASLFCRTKSTCEDLPAKCSGNDDCPSHHTCLAQMCLTNNGLACTIDQNCLSGFCKKLADGRQVCEPAEVTCAAACKPPSFCDPATGMCKLRALERVRDALIDRLRTTGHLGR